MQIPLRLSFRGMAPSAAIEAKVRERVGKLDRFYGRVTGCRVVVEAPHRRHHQGMLFHVRVDLTMPGGAVAVSREPAGHHAHEDVYVAIRDAFDATQRRLEDHARRQRGDQKIHESPPSGRVSALFPNEGYGFIATADGAEVYFHENSVLDNAFSHLKVGSGVEFVSERGEKGIQASTVRLIDKRR